MWAQPWRGREGDNQLNVRQTGWGGGSVYGHLTYSLVTSIWIPGSHLRVRASPPSRTTPQPSLCLSMCPTFKFRAGEWAVCQRVGGRDGLNWTNWRVLLTDLAQWNPIWYLESGVVVTFFSNKNCIIAEWAESRSWAREWGEAVGNLDRVCGARKNFADVLIKNLTANWGRKTYSKSIYHCGAIICHCLISVIWHLSRWLS